LSLKAVSTLLGHARAELTLKTYIHLMKESLEGAGEKIEAALKNIGDSIDTDTACEAESRA
jgi:hypothetical protein